MKFTPSTRMTAFQMGMALPLAALWLALGGCSKPDPASDKASCQMEVARLGKDWSTEKRQRSVDQCMTAKGWKPAPECSRLGIEGTEQCEYVRR